MKYEFLLDAISHIDLDVIEHYFVVGPDRYAWKKRLAKRWLPIVACMAIAFAMGIGIYLNIQSIQGETINAAPLNKPVSCEAGTITLTKVDSEHHTCTFFLDKKNNAPIYFVFEGVMLGNKWEDNRGYAKRDVELVEAYFPSNYSKKNKNGYKILEVEFSVNVNGLPVNKLPQEKGQYEITIDYSEFCQDVDGFTGYVEVYPFGLFEVEVFEPDMNGFFNVTLAE